MLELIAFLAGAGVMVLEMVGARLMAPYLGSSILVWTALIGVVLASLSLGYWLGGKAADRQPSRRKLGLLLFCAASTVLLIGLGHRAVLGLVGSYGLSLQVAALVGAGALFAPASILLGMVSPYIIRVAIESRGVTAGHSGSLIGRFFAISSLGSILGTFLGGYFLISWLGSGIIIYFLAALLMLVSALSFGPRKLGWFLLPVLGLALCMTLALRGQEALEKQARAGRVELDSRYSHMEIVDVKDADGKRMRYLLTGPRLVHSGMDTQNPDALMLNYTRYYSLAWHLRPGAENMLVLGGGGYSVPKYLLSSRLPEGPFKRLDVVEIDPGMTQAAYDYFALKDDPRLHVYHEDARMFLNRFAQDAANGADLPREGYDVVMGDVFGSAYSIPFHVGTVECARLIKDSLKPDGIYITNIISGVEGDAGKLFRGLYASVSAVFPEVRVFLTSDTADGRAVQNIMLVAFKNKQTLPEAAELARMLKEGNTLAPGVKPEYANAEAGMAFLALKQEWKKPIPRDVPPLHDEFAPVELYSMPIFAHIFR